MWTLIARIVLRQRWLLLGIIGAITITMGYFATNVKMSYEMAQMLPDTDTTFQEYTEFKKRFGEDGNMMVIGLKDPKLFSLEHFNALYTLGEEIKKLEGVEEVLSAARCINIFKNDSLHQFSYSTLVRQLPKTQKEVDSLKDKFHSLKFYDGLLYNSTTDVYLIGITLDKKKLNDKSRVVLIKNIKAKTDAFSEEMNVELHYSGLPYIRTVTSQKIKDELMFFVFLSLLIAMVILAFVFRSSRAVFSSLIIVAISVTMTLGFIGMLGYKITILTGLLPSLLIVIGIENCIYLVNKYHFEYKSHGNKIKALSRIIQRVGVATFMTNATTAVGFATFMFTPNKMLSEFGLVASVNIILEFLLSIILIPILFSMMPAPKEKHVKHLENRWFNKIIEYIILLFTKHRVIVFTFTILLVGISIFGALKIHTSGKVVDDLREDDPIYLDLCFFEDNFKGVMPFEISIDTKKKRLAMTYKTIKKVNDLQEQILAMPYFAKPLSLAELVKFTRQAYYNGNPDKYDMPSKNESAFIFDYMPKSGTEKQGNLLKAFLDTSKQFTRISFQMKDVGLAEMKEIVPEVKAMADSVFDPEKYNVVITGNSVVYTKGTEFLISNLMESVLYAILFIGVLMTLLFSSFRMILVSMIANIIPLVVVAGMMGFFGIPLKPSTIIVFSVALGISVDNAIQYLSRYRLEIRRRKCSIPNAVVSAMHETGYSMLYTSIVLVFGFGIFILSDFGGTQALGILVGTTLFVAMFCNIVFLPSMLLALDKIITTKAFEKPILDVFEEESDDNSDADGDEDDNNSEK
ncbi:MAG: transporter [Bacteroidetes bacterium HGW-Bacteroidetes-21]|nr:MAG: transporter [Bacteroidetes bacterium HGW-Bacteroidetes-21]